MEKETVQFMTDAKTAEVVNGVLKNLNLDTPVAAIPNNFNIANMEKFRVNRSRFRGIFKTDSVDEYHCYCADNASEQDEAQVCVSGSNMTAEAIFNLMEDGLPGHADHTATLQLKKTAAYKTLLENCQGTVSQMSLSNLLEDWSDFIKVKDSAGNDISLINAVATVRKVTIESAREISSEVGDFDNTASVMERAAAKDKDKLPAVIEFSCEPFSGLSERTFRIRVAINTGSAEPKFNLRIVGLEAAQDEITDEFKKLVEEKLKDLPINVFIGSFSA